MTIECVLITYLSINVKIINIVWFGVYGTEQLNTIHLIQYNTRFFEKLSALNLKRYPPPQFEKAILLLPGGARMGGYSLNPTHF